MWSINTCGLPIASTDAGSLHNGNAGADPSAGQIATRDRLGMSWCNCRRRVKRSRIVHLVGQPKPINSEDS